MLTSIVAWLFYELPWYVQIGILAIAVGIPIYILAVAIFGAQVANRYLLHGIILIVTIGMASRWRQQGWNARKDEEKRAEERAEKIADDIRDDVQRLPDDKLDQKVDKWTK